MRQRHTEYIGHGGRDEYSDLWPPEAQQQREYHYCLYEVKIEGEIDLETGKFYAQSLAGVPLAHEVEV